MYVVLVLILLLFNGRRKITLKICWDEHLLVNSFITNLVDSQEDNQASPFGCPHIFSGQTLRTRGCLNFATLTVLSVYMVSITINVTGRLAMFPFSLLTH